MSLCKICGNKGNNTHYSVREMHFGTRETFDYFQCGQCNCLQLSQMPDDLSKYYPADYYSLDDNLLNENNSIKAIICKSRDSYVLFKKGLIGKIINRYYPNSRFELLGRMQLTKKSRVLDVGCGSGKLLCALNELGIKNVSGVDPFAKESNINGVRIHKKSIFDIDGKWDLIMFNHSFEHIREQAETLKKVSTLLEDDATCIIRVPTVESFAWKHYGPNWVQLDAPRHLFLHSIRSMNILCNAVNMKLYHSEYDSTGFQFWGSEQYLMDIPLNSAKSYLVNQKSSVFSPKEIAQFELKSKELNHQEQGDQMTFLLSLNRNK